MAVRRCRPRGCGLLDTTLDAPVFNPAGDERSGAQFWLRSLLNESVIHGADAAAAAGHQDDVDADIAADLITNHLAMLTSPGWAANARTPLPPWPAPAKPCPGTPPTNPASATPASGSSNAAPDGAIWQARPGKADVAVHGPASSLLLILTRRLPLTDEHLSDVSIDGDIDLVGHWIQHSAHVTG